MNILPALIFMAVISTLAFLIDVGTRDHWDYSDKPTWRTYALAGSIVFFGVAACLVGTKQ